MNNQSIIDACLTCFEACESCATECIDMVEENHLQCISLCRDCSEICTLSVKLEQRDSDFKQQVLKLCADICNACANECEKFDEHDHCTKCAEACRKCAEVCAAA